VANVGDQNVYEFSANLADGHEISLAQYAGKVLLIVNTASKCGFTPQYVGLESLYQQYKDRGLIVLGFPCNQFGQQEPGTDSEITRFCELNYGVSFPIFAKIDVNGPDAHPLFQYLRKVQPGIFGSLGLSALGSIKWNFTKFLVDRRGKAVERYAPSTAPAALAADIEKLLGNGYPSSGTVAN
jgi:glutathione peroxidase